MSNEKNQLQKTQNLNAYLDLPAVTVRLSEKLGLEEFKKFKAALSSAVSTNPVLLTECEPGSVVTAALIGHSLNLPPSPQLGYYYIVPYNNKYKNRKEGQFQIGYKGYIQLAMRSGYYKKLNVTEIKEGEFKKWGPLTEELEVEFIDAPDEREKAETIGYCAYFEYINGFTKTIYWTRKRVEIHADKYSKAYSLATDKELKSGKIPQKDIWKYASFWYSDFDGMAKKTLLRQLLSKWGSMSVDMQRAFEEDIKADGVSFAQAQISAEETISNQTGSEMLDAAFEEEKPVDPEAVDPKTKAKARKGIKKLKEADAKAKTQKEMPQPTFL
jgi:recombination protein RecT